MATLSYSLMWGLSSVPPVNQADARVNELVENIGNDVSNSPKESCQQHGRHDHWIVSVPGAGHEVSPQPGNAERGFDEDRPGGNIRDLGAQHSDHGDQGIF